MTINGTYVKACFAVFKFTLGATFVIGISIHLPNFSVAIILHRCFAIGNFADALRLAKSISTATHSRLAFTWLDIQASNRLPIIVFTFIIRFRLAVNSSKAVLTYAVSLLRHAIVIRNMLAGSERRFRATNRFISFNAITARGPSTIRTRFNGARAQRLLRKWRTAVFHRRRNWRILRRRGAVQFVWRRATCAIAGHPHFTKLFDGVTTLREQCGTLRAERDIGWRTYNKLRTRGLRARLFNRRGLSVASSVIIRAA